MCSHKNVLGWELNSKLACIGHKRSVKKKPTKVCAINFNINSNISMFIYKVTINYFLDFPNLLYEKN